jgi:hypothetical protein
MDSGLFDGRGHTLEGHRQVLDPGPVGGVVDQAAQPVVGVEIGPVADQVGELADHRTGKDVPGLQLRPHLGEALDRRRRGIGGDGDAVEGADAGAHHQIRDETSLEEGPQHAHFGRSQHASAAEHEGGGRPGRSTAAGGDTGGAGPRLLLCRVRMGRRVHRFPPGATVATCGHGRR